MPALNDSIFWIDVEKIKPNPYQPRRDFNPDALESLADSIRQYGVLQPIVVTRKEVHREDGGLATEYELISGERRLRASKLVGLAQIPAVIRDEEHSDQMKLEIAIIENLQREDLNPVERAEAFSKLASEFNYKHHQIGKKVGCSREHVSNTIRLLNLPEDMIEGIRAGVITEGHARPILMLADRPEEQIVLYKDIINKQMTVRDAEKVSRKIAYDRVRKKEFMPDPELVEIEQKLKDKLGVDFDVERREAGGGKVVIDFGSNEDLWNFLRQLDQEKREREDEELIEKLEEGINPVEEEEKKEPVFEDKTDSDLYSVSNFGI